MSLLRCLYGFGVGVLVAMLRPAAIRIRTVAELVAAIATVLFISIAVEPFALVAPPLFGGVVLLFSYEQGAVSKALLRKPLRWLGLLAYSIYMTHSFILGRMGDVAELASKRLQWPLATACHGHDGCFVATGWLRPSYIAAFTGVLLAVSWLSYTLVEAPGRRWSR